MIPNLSLVVLAYNEQDSLAATIGECLAYLDGKPGDHEVIIVDDGSDDDTGEIAAALVSSDGRVRVVSHPENRGMGAGMRSGYRAASRDYVCMLPADGQIAAESIDVLLPALSRAPIVTSIYSRRPSERYRILLSVGMRTLMRLLVGLSFRLEGIYLFPTAALAEVDLDKVGAETFFFSFELVSRAMALGLTVETVTIAPRPRAGGQSKVANLARIRRVASELWSFRQRLAAERSEAVPGA